MQKCPSVRPKEKIILAVLAKYKDAMTFRQIVVASDWEVFSSFYTYIKCLEQEGLVKTLPREPDNNTKENKNLYRLTKKGKAYCEQYLKKMIK